MRIYAALKHVISELKVHSEGNSYCYILHLSLTF